MQTATAQQWNEFPTDRPHRFTPSSRVERPFPSEMAIETHFEVLVAQTNRIMGTERTTVFLHDPEADQLWSLAATGLKTNTIRIPAHQGISGWVFQHRTPLLINDVSRDDRFHPIIDEETGFCARSILCIPLINRRGHCIGVLQALNKAAGDFIEDDWDLLRSVSHYMVVALKNARLCEELKAMDKARERLIHHLSHELRTPLAILSAVLTQISRYIPADAVPKLERIVDRGRRNLDRLADIQKKIDDIIQNNHTPQQQRLINLIQSATDIVQELDEPDSSVMAKIMTRIHERLAGIYALTDESPSNIDLGGFLNDVCDEAECRMRGRDIEILRNIENGLCLWIGESVLRKTCVGLLKNAVENTPDGGRIEVTASVNEDGIRVDFTDFGVGITPQNQKLIFGGFFHTQDTHLYRSGRPYHFNAGGSGSDLLRIKVFSERYGFSVEFDSSRCPFLPGDRDICTGRIADCQFIYSRADCLSSGGSRFSIGFCQSENHEHAMSLRSEEKHCFI